jgi:hypothetical protein
LDGETREADLDSVRGEADDVEEETGGCTPRDRPDRGPGTQGRIRRHKEQPTKLRISRGAMVEMRTQLAIERGGLGNPPPTAGASELYPHH